MSKVSKKNNNNNNSTIEFILNKMIYIQKIIQNTILSIKTNKKNNIFSENDIILSISILIEINEKIIQIYERTSECENINSNELIEELQKIIDKLALVICGFGTKNIEELLYVTFGSEFTNLKFQDEYVDAKYQLIKDLCNPIGYKIQNNKKMTKTNSICSNKLTDDIIEIEHMANLECLDDKDVNEIPMINKLSHIKIIIHNYKLKKTIIINAITEDMPLKCLNNDYINYRQIEIKDTQKGLPRDEKEIFKNIIQSLSLKDLLVFGKDDIKKRIIVVLKDVEYVKQTHIDTVVKNFLEKELNNQRDFLINLILYKEDSDIQHTCFILYDLINTATTEGDNETIGNKIYESFPWSIKQNFKSIVKSNIQITQKIMQKYETNKINLEQQIHMLKVDDSVKEKAINKLKEMSGKPDDMTIKTRQFLEGLVKIPFETYYEEPIIKIMKENNINYKNLFINYKDILKNTISDTKNKYTNNELGFLTEKIENTSKDLLKQIIIENLSKCKLQKLNELIVIINKYNKQKNIKNFTIEKKSKKNIYLLINSFIQSREHNEEILLNIYDKMQITKCKATNFIKDVSIIKSNTSKISKSIDSMEDILDNSIHGHSNAKNQIIKIIGQWMNGEKSGYSFGFEGSPGIGKTSLANKGLTKCLTNKDGNSRPFNFIALGGSSNGSFLEGHGYTYMNSTWGKIVDILMDSKCMNPIIYIDELDKVSKTEQGKEIIGILTHLIDPTQNTNFQDKYFSGINIDVSKVLFIFSYNDPEQIDKILLDRIHRIKFENLSLDEKITVVNKFILPEINLKMGFENIVSIDEKCIEYIIKSYTLEPGVRKLKEILFDLYGEINLQLLRENKETVIPIKITSENLDNIYLTKYNKIKEKHVHSNPEIGIINGLWANSLGSGGIIPIQTLFYPSSSFLELQLTGLQGDVMKESMNVAKSLAWNLTEDDVKQKWLKYFEKTKCQGLHIHCPEGAISKDGPSAGAAITTAIYSLINQKKIKNDIAITGEITLNGDVTAIGGLDIKISSGIRNGVKTFLFPRENHREFVLWKEKNANQEDIEFLEINNIREILLQVFV
jgi:hypothetical protein